MANHQQYQYPHEDDNGEEEIRFSNGDQRDATSRFLFGAHNDDDDDANMASEDYSQSAGTMANSEGPDPEEVRQRAARALQLANLATSTHASPTYGRSSKRTPKVGSIGLGINDSPAGESSFQFGFSHRTSSPKRSPSSPSSPSSSTSSSYDPVHYDDYSYRPNDTYAMPSSRIDQMINKLPRKERSTIISNYKQPQHPFEVIDQQYESKKTSRMINTAKERFLDMFGCDSDVRDEDNRNGTTKWLKRSIVFIFVIVLLAIFMPVFIPDDKQESSQSPPSSMPGGEGEGSTVGSNVGDQQDEDPMQIAETMGLLRSIFVRHFIAEKEVFMNDTPQRMALSWLSSTNLANEVAQSNYQHQSHTPSTNWEQDKLLRPLVEQYSLAVLFYTMTELEETPWANEDGWLVSSATSSLNVNDHCYYFGVSCTSLYENDKQLRKFNVVSGLNLTENGLQNYIPTEIALLRNLESIVLSYNALSGPIPTELGTLSNLQVLDLGFNYMYGEIPDEVLVQWSNLQYLGLNDNDLTGSIPETLGSSLTSLEYLYLENNNLTWTIPESIGQIPNLQDVRLHLNQLSGPFPNVLATMSNLELLYVDDNYLTGMFSSLPVSLFQSHKLKEIRFANNKLSGSLPLYFFALPNLEYLHLSENTFSGSLPDSLGDATLLKQFTARFNDLVGAVPTSIEKLVNLEFLDLGENQLTEVLPAEMGNLVSLQELYMENNRLQNEIPYEMGNLSNLEILQMHWNAFTGQVPDEICNLRDENGGVLEMLTVDCAGGKAAALIQCHCCTRCY